MKRRIAGGVLFALILSPGSRVTAPAVLADTPSTTAQAIAFRTQFGLRSDAAYVGSIAIDPHATDRLGIPLTLEEAAEIDRRDRAAASIGDLEASLADVPDFAGLYFDQQDSGRLVIRVLGSGGATRIAVSSAQLPALRFDEGDFSWAALVRLRNTIEDELPALHSKYGVSSLWTNPRSDRVEIGLDPFSQSVADNLKSVLGPMVDVYDDPIAEPASAPCNSRSDCPDPFKGGIGINNTFNGTSWCTSGFPARKTSGGTANHWYLLTAGHCIWAKLPGSTWLAGTAMLYIGQEIAYNWCDGCTSDVGIISISAWDTPTDLVFANTNTDIRSITSLRTNAQQSLGAPACRGGWASNNFNCGQVDVVDMSHYVDNLQGGSWLQIHQWRMNEGSTKGDSGGPVMYGTSALGIVNSGTTTTWYSTIDYIKLVGYQPCTTAISNPCL